MATSVLTTLSISRYPVEEIGTLRIFNRDAMDRVVRPGAR